MASPTHTWTDVISAFLGGLQEVLYQVGAFISSNAQAIAYAVIGAGLAFGLYAVFTRIPMIRNILGRLF
jgi:hypothetical protein